MLVNGCPSRGKDHFLHFSLCLVSLPACIIIIICSICFMVPCYQYSWGQTCFSSQHWQSYYNQINWYSPNMPSPSCISHIPAWIHVSLCLWSFLLFVEHNQIHNSCLITEKWFSEEVNVIFYFKNICVLLFIVTICKIRATLDLTPSVCLLLLHCLCHSEPGIFNNNIPANEQRS